MPLSLSASYCFSFLTFAFLLGMRWGLPGSPGENTVTLDGTMSTAAGPRALGFLRTGVVTGVETVRRGADVALALPRIALALERLASSADDLRRLADTGDELRRL